MRKSSLILQREYNAGIPGTLISTSCVFNPSLGRTSCLMRLRSSLTHADWVIMPVKTPMHSPIWPWTWQWKAKGRWSDVFSQHSLLFQMLSPKKAVTFLTITVRGLLFPGGGGGFVWVTEWGNMWQIHLDLHQWKEKGTDWVQTWMLVERSELVCAWWQGSYVVVCVQHVPVLCRT